jgi:hypothetical protein
MTSLVLVLKLGLAYRCDSEDLILPFSVFGQTHFLFEVFLFYLAFPFFNALWVDLEESLGLGTIRGFLKHLVAKPLF